VNGAPRQRRWFAELPLSGFSRTRVALDPNSEEAAQTLANSHLIRAARKETNLSRLST
jgi:hypothetical protein